MPARHIAQFNPFRGTQSGAVLFVMLVILVIGAAALLVSALNSSSVKNARDQTTVDALAKAKEALISYAVIYGDRHSGYASGYLPCPDPNGTGSGITKEGSSETCTGTNISTLGRLPWKTLGLQPLLDGNGECLWYAVSGTYQNNPSTGNLMNWDNNGLFQILSSSSVILAGQTADSYAVAAIFSPGVVLGGQSQNRSPDGSAPLCGGNYTATNYLDRDTAIGANNATPSTVALAISQFFAAGATANINDQIIYITKSDIFNAIKKRNDFGTATVAALLNASKACNPAHPATLNFNLSPPQETIPSGLFVGVGSNRLEIGRVPKSCLAAPLNNWQDNLLFATCTSGSCLTVNGAVCNGIIVFTGEKNASQMRIINADKNNWSNYLEGSTLSVFQGTATSIPSAALSYTSAAPSTDIVVCL